MEQNEHVLVREARFGDASYLSWLHAQVYRDGYGFNDIFEYYVLKGMAGYLGRPEGGKMWVAEVNGEIVGGVAVVRATSESAQLRWFVVKHGCQGKGIGGRLLSRALAFCRGSGYRRVFLWTVGILEPARHMYEKFGFRMTEQKTNTEWTGQPLTEERWDIDL